MSAPLLEVRDLGLGLKSPPLLTGVSWSLSEGERLIVSGPSGAGKSVMLRALVGLLPATGEVRLGGRETTALPPTEVRGRMVWVPQTAPRLPGTVRENITAVRLLTGVKERVAPWKETLESAAALGIAELMDTPADRISGGEAQRMGLLRALQLRPEILLLDEPTSALDPAAGRVVEEMIIGWSGQEPGRGVVWVAHDRDQASRVGTCFLRVEGGTAVREAAP